MPMIFGEKACCLIGRCAECIDAHMMVLQHVTVQIMTREFEIAYPCEKTSKESAPLRLEKNTKSTFCIVTRYKRENIWGNVRRVPAYVAGVISD